HQRKQTPGQSIANSSTRQCQRTYLRTQHILFREKACEHRKSRDGHRCSHQQHKGDKSCFWPCQVGIEKVREQSTCDEGEESSAQRDNKCATTLTQHQVRIQARS